MSIEDLSTEGSLAGLSRQLPSFRRALVTGGCGFIGHHLVRRLLESGIAVTILDDLSTGRLENLPEHRELEWIEGSVLDRETVARAVDGADLIFHLASMVGMRRVDKDPDGAYRISSQGTQILLDASASIPFVAFSSSSVYGLETRGRVAEDDALSDGHALAYDSGRPGYASGKWAMENLVLAVREERPILVLRPFNVIGEGQSGSYGMVVPRFLAQAAAGLPLSVYGDGEQERCFSCVHGFVDRVLRLVELPTAWRSPTNVLNIGSDEPTAIGDLARIVIEETGSSSRIETVVYDEVYPGRRDVRWRSPNLERIEGLLGPEPWPTIRELVRRLVASSQPAASLEQVGG